MVEGRGGCSADYCGCGRVVGPGQAGVSWVSSLPLLQVQGAPGCRVDVLLAGTETRCPGVSASGWVCGFCFGLRSRQCNARAPEILRCFFLTVKLYEESKYNRVWSSPMSPPMRCSNARVRLRAGAVGAVRCVYVQSPPNTLGQSDAPDALPPLLWLDPTRAKSGVAHAIDKE